MLEPLKPVRKIISNNHDLKMADSDQVVLHMGIAHANQAFRAVIMTTATGLAVYNDDNAPIRYTDANGDLIFTNKDVSIVVWIPFSFNFLNTSIRKLL